MLRDTIRITLLGLLLLSATALAVGGIFYTSMISQTQERELSKFAAYLEIGTLQVGHEVEEAKRRLRFLARTPPIQGIIRARANGGVDPEDLSSEAQWTARLKDLFRNIVEQNPYIIQARFIGEAQGGREIVRVNRLEDEITVTRDEDLQQKWDRPYFQHIMRLASGEIHEGPIDLNVEHGVIERPWQPVIRLGTPIYSEAGDFFGIVIINLDAEHLLRTLRESIPRKVDLIVSGAGGQILFGPGQQMRYGYLFGQPARLQDMFPELTRAISGDQDIYSGLAANPVHEPTVIYARQLTLDRDAGQQEYFAALSIPNDLLTAGARETGLRILILTVVFCSLSGWLFFYASWRFSAPIENLAAAARRIVDGESPSKVDWPHTANRSVQHVTDAFVSIIASLSDREAAMEESNERLQTVLDGTEDAILLIEKDGTIRIANRSAQNMFGYDADELIGQNASLLAPPPEGFTQDPDAAKPVAPEIIKIIGKTRELTGRRKGGSSFDFELKVSRTTRGRSEKFVVIMSDISTRRGLARLKSEFVATVSHELRTPLAAIKGSLGLLLTGNLGTLNDAGQEFLNAAYSNCSRIIDLINDILDMERITTGRMRFEVNRIDLRDVVHKAASECRGMADPRGISITEKLSTAPAYALGDTGRLVQVITNLLSNAVKFSPPGSAVAVSIERRDGGWTIAVSDNGPGIPKEFHGSLFERFTQAEGSTSRPAGGSGLGLAISKAIVDFHHGEISFRTSDRGTTFFVYLASSDTSAESELSSSEALMGRVLICVSDLETSDMLHDALSSAGYDVDISTIREEALLWLETQKYDAILVDWTNTDHLGQRILAGMAKLPKDATPPVVVLNANSGDELAPEAMFDTLAMHWIKKPFKQDQLVQAFETLTLNQGKEPLKVLHVEDEVDHQKLVEMLLKGLAVVTHAGTVAEASALLAKSDYDVVLLDQYLPDGDGLTLLDQLQQKDPYPEIMVFSIDLPPPEVRSHVSSSLVKSRADNRKFISEIRRLIKASQRNKN